MLWADVHSILLALAAIVGPAGLAGMVIAWLGKRNQDKKPPAVSHEAMAVIGHGVGNQLALDELSLRITQLSFSIDRNTIATNDLLAELKSRPVK